MGQSIVYCCRCRVQLREPEFERKAAFRFEDLSCCLDCAGDVIKSLPEPKAKILLSRLSEARPTPDLPRMPGRGTALPPPRPSHSSVRLTSLPTRFPRSGRLAIALAVGGLAAALGVVLRTPSARPPPNSEDVRGLPAPMPAATIRKEEKTPVQPSPAAVEPRIDDEKARKVLDLLAKLKVLRREEPLNFDGQAALADEAVWAASGTPILAVAMANLEEIRRLERGSYGPELEDLDRRVAETRAAERFAQGLALLGEARKRRASPAWTLAVGQRERTLGEEAVKVFDELKAKALEAQSRGLTQEIEAIQRRIEAWGTPDLEKELKKALSSED